jgi:hypothetical protein
VVGHREVDVPQMRDEPVGHGEYSSVVTRVG